MSNRHQPEMALDTKGPFFSLRLLLIGIKAREVSCEDIIEPPSHPSSDIQLMTTNNEIKEGKNMSRCVEV